MKTATIGMVALVALALGLSGGYGARAHDEKAPPGHVMITPQNVKWMDVPASLPRGAKLAVINGDPTKPGPFTMRLKAPANYKIPPHWHPKDEHVTVLSGTFYMGLGEQFDAAKSRALPVGSFAVMATGTRHFAWTKREDVVQLHGIGPWGINYVNPADDPRGRAAQAAK